VVEAIGAALVAAVTAGVASPGWAGSGLGVTPELHPARHSQPVQHAATVIAVDRVIVRISRLPLLELSGHRRAPVTRQHPTPEGDETKRV
jgi:hypothetical protein